MAITIPIFYVPFLQEVFYAYALGLTDWLIAILSASTIFIGLEIYKLVNSQLKPKGLVPEPTG
jgi:hypothetical protein